MRPAIFYSDFVCLFVLQTESNTIRQTIANVLPDYPIHRKHNILAAVINETLQPSSGNAMLKSLLLDKQVFNAKTLQQICIDNFNVNGRRYLNSVLDYELPPVSTDEDQSKIDEDSLDTSTFEMSRRVKKKKRRNPLRDYIRRGKRRRIGVAQREINATPPVHDTSIDSKAESIQSTANTQSSNEPAVSESTPPPVRKKPGPKPKSKQLPVGDEAASGQLDKEFVHWKKPGPQVIIESKRLRRSQRQFDNESSSKEELVDVTVVKVKRSASKEKVSESAKKTTQPVDDDQLDSALDVPNEAKPTNDNDESKEQPPTDTETMDDKNGLADVVAPSTGKAKILILNPKEVLKESEDLSNEAAVKSDAMSTKSTDDHDNQSPLEDSGRPSSKNRKRIDDVDVTCSENNKKKRQTSRINYSEALVDEALMYEEMLLNEQAKEQLFIASTIESSKQQKTKANDAVGKNNFSMDYDDGDVNAKTKTKYDVALENLGEICVSRKEKASPKESNMPADNVKKKEMIGPDVELSEISITPISKPKTTAITNDNQINVSLKEIKQTFKSNPEFVFNISSAVSIQLKSASCCKSDPSQKGSTTCQYCRKAFADIKQLAVHQLIHLKVETHKIGSPLVLSPSFRRGRMVPMGNNKCFRCLNCWRLYPNSQSILQHWVTGKCIFYCSICGQSFHQNPKLIRDHFPEVHGIKFKMPTSAAPPGLMPADPTLLATHAAQRMNRAKYKEQIKAVVAAVPGVPGRSFSVIKMKPPVGRVKCHICSCSFPNMQSRNSHMRLHKNEKEPIKPINLRQLVSQQQQQQRPIQMNFNNIQQRQLFPNVNRIQPNHAIGAPHRPFRMAAPSQQRAIKPAEQHRPFSNQQSQQRAYSQSFTVGDNFGPVKIKTESNYDADYNASEFPSNSGDFPEYSELFQSEPVTEPTTALTNFIKSEMQPEIGGGVPRLQVKKLHELQEPNYVNAQPISVNTFYTPTTIQPIVNAIPQYQLATPLQLQVPQLQPIQPQFQIASVQHVQNTQYYNPVLVVSQPPQHTQEGYQYVPEQVDYSKYYS